MRVVVARARETLIKLCNWRRRLMINLYKTSGGIVKTKFYVTMATALLAMTAFSHAQAGDDMKKAADDTGKATKTAATKTAGATKTAAKDTGKATEKAADKTADATKTGAKNTGKGVKKGTKAVGHGVKTGADKTADAVK
jgi:hypothetical protein